MDYLVGLGHGLDVEDLSPWVVQPQCADGVIAAQVDFGADGSIFEQGYYARLVWPALETIEEYQQILAQAGLDAFMRRAVSVYLPDFQRAWHLYNGYAIRPRTPNYRLWPNDVTMMINRLKRNG